jgi:cell division transport system permease protein
MRLLTREALLSFRRAPLLSALSVTTIAFSLFTVGLFGLIAINLREALRDLEERVEIVAFVLRGTPPETITLASQDIATFPEVLTVTYVTEDDALARARRELVEFRDAYRDLQVNPLPASLEIRLREGFRDAGHAAAVAERVRGFSFVEDVRFGRDWVEQLDDLRDLAGILGLVIGGVFAAVAIVIIGVTIRLTLLQRAREIHIMRLVGATNWFIRGPFLLEGALKGFLGGVLALVLCYAGYTAFRNNTSVLGGLVFFGPHHMFVIVVFGVLLGLFGSLVSVGRHLRTVSGRLDRRMV